jgi:hypothetical protein
MNTLLAPVFLYLIIGFIVIVIIAIAIRNIEEKKGHGIAGIMFGVFSLGLTLIIIFVAPLDPRYLSDEGYRVGITAFVILFIILLLLGAWFSTLRSLFAGANIYSYISLSLCLVLTFLYVFLGNYYYPYG